MAAWSAEIANEFIRRAGADGKAFTQMQLQKLVYIAHGWNLAINDKPLTFDDPQAWDYGPVYRDLSRALRQYGRIPVSREIKNCEFSPTIFLSDSEAPAVATNLTSDEIAVIDRVYSQYGHLHAFQLSALTHMPGTPWTQVYGGGAGKYKQIDGDLIQRHFLDLANKPAA